MFAEAAARAIAAATLRAATRIPLRFRRRISASASVISAVAESACIAGIPPITATAIAAIVSATEQD